MWLSADIVELYTMAAASTLKQKTVPGIKNEVEVECDIPPKIHELYNTDSSGNCGDKKQAFAPQ